MTVQHHAVCCSSNCFKLLQYLSLVHNWVINGLRGGRRCIDHQRSSRDMCGSQQCRKFGAKARLAHSVNAATENQKVHFETRSSIILLWPKCSRSETTHQP